jgi:hypothetical protein
VPLGQLHPAWVRTRPSRRAARRCRSRKVLHERLHEGFHGISRPYDEAVPRHRLSVYLHVGPPKTGSTYLQDALWRNRRLSRSRDVDLPGSRPLDHFYAALDLRGIDFGGHVNPKVPGAWKRLAASAVSTDLGKVVISHEVLAGATVEQIEFAVTSLAPASVHVVYGARDLARQLPAVWQESLKNRRTRSYDAFLAAALKPRDSEVEQRGFWRAQDAVATLQRWASVVPPERISVVTVPPAGAPPSTLWERFCAAIELDPTGYDLDIARANGSLPAEDAEVLRRLNAVLGDELTWPDYEHAVKRRFNARANATPPGGRLLVPERYRAAVTERAQDICGQLRQAGYAVSGDLDDLIPTDSSFGDPPSVSADRVADAAVEVLAGVLTEPGRRVGRVRGPAGAALGRLRRR